LAISGVVGADGADDLEGALLLYRLPDRAPALISFPRRCFTPSALLVEFFHRGVHALAAELADLESLTIW